MRTVASLLFLFISQWIVAQEFSYVDLLINNYDNEYETTLAIVDTLNLDDYSIYEQYRIKIAESAAQYGIDHDAPAHYNRLLELKKSCDPQDLKSLFYINDELIYAYFYVSEVPDGFMDLIEVNKKIAKKLEDPDLEITSYLYSTGYLIHNNQYNQAKNELWKAREIAKEYNKTEDIFTVESNLSVVYQRQGLLDSALIFQKKIEKYYSKIKDTTGLYGNYNNTGQVYKRMENYEKFLEYTLKAQELAPDNLDLLNLINNKRNLAEAYHYNNKYKLSSELFVDVLDNIDTINARQSESKIQELEAKYETAEKEKKIAEQETKNEQNQKVIIALIATAVLISVIGLWFYNNQRKKKLLVEKEKKLIMAQKDKILKEQELSTIDAMIAGQEKERKEIATELHDDLGSSLTTMKLHFENLKRQAAQQDNKIYFDRTEQLLNDTYEKIRQMSHKRFTGVLASKGLIPSVESLAQKISQSKELDVEVIHYGLDTTLENSLELLIFRIIQELLNNIIKHAQASEAFINLTAYEDHLNIMIEDNGIGMNVVSIKPTDGMGLYSIEKKVENTGGTFEIDSQPGFGTTITIDIPL
ncbi:sensory box histidine kinase [Nonlabens tegetincola]|uniref:Oxygen sensor histidine kinase NreB n=2 Tax=Nonlabens tegetincola TaxID=323273 RepID=A0A090QMV3_9FLAO|nr:sensor histidine kinase [Nonlabens tegetincola]MEE2802720.1 sensor histidine kinase [Bacteroidota bacterium]GAK96856.1 sensory box histidine kinase [Nonlabens tegetincola]